MFISQLKIYKEKENLSINIYIKNHPVFLFASPSSVAKETSVLKVSPSHWRRSGSSSMITRFANLMTIWNKFLKFYFVFNLRAHTQWIWKRTSKQWALFSFFFTTAEEVFITAMFSWSSHSCSVVLEIESASFWVQWKEKFTGGLLWALENKGSTTPTSRPPSSLSLP